jgi:hypothetical protein
MLAPCGNNPFLPHRPEKSIAEDLIWWLDLLQSGGASRNIYPQTSLKDPSAFSDASSGVGIGIVIGERWRAWRLIPGWKTHNGKRDIGWAEAVGFELLVYTLATFTNIGSNVLVHGDNTGVVEGWWKRRHRNTAVNGVFKRISNFLHDLPNRLDISTAYIASGSNPADDPSRGIYGPISLLLPKIPIPDELSTFIIDATEPLSPAEIRHLRDGNYTPPAAKLINRALIKQQAAERAATARAEEDYIVSCALKDE